MRTSAWTPDIGRLCWVKPQRFAGEIIGKQPGKWQVRYLAKAKGFDNKMITQETTGWFPGARLERRL